MSPTFELISQLIGRRSVTSVDGGCQTLIASRLARLDLCAKTIAQGRTSSRREIGDLDPLKTITAGLSNCC